MRKKFLKKRTTSFQEKVYEVVNKIPRGKVLSYKEVAKLAGRPRAQRAIGNLLNKNLDPTAIPCYRVIKSDGSMGGHNKGTKRKIALLKTEGALAKKSTSCNMSKEDY